MITTLTLVIILVSCVQRMSRQRHYYHICSVFIHRRWRFYSFCTMWTPTTIYSHHVMSCCVNRKQAAGSFY